MDSKKMFSRQHYNAIAKVARTAEVELSTNPTASLGMHHFLLMLAEYFQYDNPAFDAASFLAQSKPGWVGKTSS